jgi:outer membrane protein, multidrug efflux system
MKRYTVLVIVLLVILLAGCTTMAPKYTRPDAPVPSQWPEAGNGSAAENTKAADLKWDGFYQDGKLQKVITLALEHNRDLRVAALNIEKAQARYRIQRAALLPSVNASGSMVRERMSADVSGTGKAYVASQYSVDMGTSSWELDFFGRIRSLKDNTLDQYFATQQARRSSQIMLVADVASAYLTLAADKDGLRLAQSTLDAANSSFAVVEGRQKAGVATELDLQQAQTVAETARAGAVRNSRLIALDKNYLDLFVGSSVPDELLPGSLASIALRADLSPGTPSDVLLARPDILDAEYQLKATNANIGAARAALFPRISLTSSVGTASDALTRLFTTGNTTWSFMPQISVPILDAGSKRADLKVAEIDRDLYVAQYEKAIQTGFREVADALSERQKLSNQMAVQESLIKATQKAFNLSEARYERGIGTYLSVLDAARSLYSAQQDLLTLQLAREKNLVTLYKVLGGGE